MESNGYTSKSNLKDKEKQHWNSDLSMSYVELFNQEHKEVSDLVPLPFIPGVLVLLNIGHFLCPTGRNTLRLMLKNSFHYMLAISTVWERDTANVYMIPSAIKLIQDSTKSYLPENDAIKYLLPLYLKYLIEIRVMLLLMIPGGSFIAIPASLLASSPIFVFDPEMNEHLPWWVGNEMCLKMATDFELLSYKNKRETVITNGSTETIDGSTEEGGQRMLKDRSWRVNIRAIKTFLHVSRGLMLLSNVAIIILTFGFMFLSSNEDSMKLNILASVCSICLIPDLLAYYLLGLLVLGDIIVVKDEDFKILWSSFLQSFSWPSTRPTYSVLLTWPSLDCQTVLGFFRVSRRVHVAND